MTLERRYQFDYNVPFSGRFSLLLTSLSVNLIDLTMLPSPDEIERLAEKLATLYQDDIEQRFSDELLQFVDYSNEFLDYA